LVGQSIGFGTPVGDDKGVDEIGLKIGVVEGGLVVGIAVSIAMSRLALPTCLRRCSFLTAH